MEEEWRGIPGIEVAFEVSNLGRVRRIVAGRGTYAGRIINPTIDNRGYPKHSLSYEGQRYTFRLSRMVAAAFLPNPDGLPVVMHLDDNPLNSRADNLRWGTQADNIHDMVAKGRSLKGRKAPRAPISHCKHGHEFTPENTRVKATGWRECRECRRISRRRYKAGKRRNAASAAKGD